MAAGQHLQSHVMGLAYYTADGRSVLIAGVTNSQGEVVEPNQVLYPDAFDTARADILYTYTPYSMEQDIIIRKKLPEPPPEFDPSQTYLAVLTEFENPPDPLQIPEFGGFAAV